MNLRIFLSFTSELMDFPVDRSFVAAARDGVVQAGGALTDMKYFAAQEEPPADVCRDKVRSCDAYVGVIGLRYGSRVRDRPKLSYTELEFEIATEAGLPRLIFMIDENASLPIPAARLTDKDEGSREDQRRFRQRLIDAGVTYKKVATPGELLHEVYAAVRPLVEARQPGVHRGTPRVPSQRQLVGREAEVGSLVGAWLAAQPEPVMVLGAAGIGKSAVCVAALRDYRVQSRFGPRRWFVRCDGSTSAQALLSVLAGTLGVIVDRQAAEEPELSEGDLADRVCAALGVSPGAMVLDNFETPWDADTQAVEDLLGTLGSIPGMRLAVTIRGAAHPAVLPWRITVVGQLPLPAARTMFLAITGPDLKSDPDLDSLVSEMDGMPLAVELLGYVAQGEPDLAGVTQRWRSERTGLLERMGGDRRELSVVASVEASVKSASMTDYARRIFAMLGMLPGGIARADIDALMPGHGLAAAVVLQQRLGLAFHEGGRLRMLAPVRGYAASRCLPRAEDLTRVIGHYIALAAIEAPADGGQAVARLNAEVGNVTWVLKRAVDMLRADEVTLDNWVSELVAGLCGLVSYWILTGTVESRLIADADEAIDAHGTGWQRARLGRAIADLALARSDYGGARHRYATALPLFQQARDVLGEANCRKGLGDIDLAQSAYEAATSAYLEALSLYQRGGSLLGEANCVRSLGNIAIESSDLESALARYEEALSLYRQSGSVLGTANCIRRLGDVELASSRHEAATYRYEEALVLYRQARSVLGEAHCIQRLGDVAAKCSNHETAAARYETALPLYRVAGEVLGEANCIKSLGDTAAALSDRNNARDRYAQALHLYRSIGDLCSIGWIYLGLAELESSEREKRRHLESARQAWVQIGRDDLIEDELG